MGEYQLNVAKSEMGHYKDSSSYHRLFLKIQQNDSFSFSMDVPFFNDSFGKWETRTIDGFSWAYLQYSNGSYGVIEDQLGFTIEGDLYINNTRPKKGHQNLPRAVFTRLDY